MPTLPVHVEVEDAAVGPLLRMLKKMPGVIGFEVKLDDVAPSFTRQHGNAVPGAIQQTVLAALLHAHPEPMRSKLIGAQTGILKGSLSSALSNLKTKGMIERLNDARGISLGWKLSAKGQTELGAMKLLPHFKSGKADHKTNGGANGKAANGDATKMRRGQPWIALYKTLADGPKDRAALKPLLGKTLDGILDRSSRKQLIKRSGDGVYQLTTKGRAAAPTAAL